MPAHSISALRFRFLSFCRVRFYHVLLEFYFLSRCMLADIFCSHSHVLCFCILQVQIRSWFLASVCRGVKYSLRILGSYFSLITSIIILVYGFGFSLYKKNY